MHPHPDRLSAFSLGKLPEHELEEIAAHLAECAACRRQAESAPDDGFVSLLRSHVTASPAARAIPVAPPGFELFEEIGRGGMAIVYRARQVALDRLVALKKIRPGRLGEAEYRNRFRREAQLAARLDHPNLVRVFEVGESEGEPYLACELVDGGTLAEYLRSPLPWRTACRLLRDLADGVQHAHENSVVHRDLKPANILLAWERESSPSTFDASAWEKVTPRIADFGLAKPLDIAGETQHGALLGTPEYMAPEQITPGEVGPAADIYSLGVIFYELLTGRRPLQGSSVAETLELARSAEPVAPRRLSPRLPRDVEAICLQCLAKSPARRYASAAELSRDLSHALAGRPVLARLPSWSERVTKWIRRHPAWSVVIAVSALAAAGHGGAISWYNRQLRDEARRAAASEQTALANFHQGLLAVERLISEVDERFDNSPEWHALNRRVRESALEFYYNAFRDAPLDRPSVRIAKGTSLVYAGAIQVYLGQEERGLVDLRQALAHLEHAARDAAARDVASPLGLCHFWLGRAHQQQGQRAEARAQFQRAAELMQPFPSEPPTPTDLDRLARAYGALASIELIESRQAAAQEPLQREFAARERLAQQLPRYQENLEGLLFCATRLAATCGQPAEAEQYFERAEQIVLSRMGGREKIVESPRLGRELARVYWSWNKFDEGLALIEQVVANHPSNAEAKRVRHMLWRSQAWKRSREGNSNAMAAWDQAVAAAPPDELAYTRCERALELARAGDAAQAAEEADAILAANDLNDRNWLHLARVYSQSLSASTQPANAPPPDERRAALVAGGLEALRRAERFLRSQPGAIAAEVDADPLFEPLRTTTEFAAWRRSLDEPPSKP